MTLPDWLVYIIDGILKQALVVTDLDLLGLLDGTVFYDPEAHLYP